VAPDNHLAGAKCIRGGNERARQVAINRNTTLNELFRDWLEQLGEGALREQSYRQQMERFKGRVQGGGRTFT